MHHAVIIEQSLKDKKVLENFKILNTKVGGKWILDILEISDIEKAIDIIQPAMVGDENFYWHIFDEGETLVIIFREKVFRIDPKDKSTWAEVTKYGSEELNIPIYQLDFFPTRISDEPSWLAGKE